MTEQEVNAALAALKSGTNVRPILESVGPGDYYNFLQQYVPPDIFKQAVLSMPDAQLNAFMAKLTGAQQSGTYTTQYPAAQGTVVSGGGSGFTTLLALAALGTAGYFIYKKVRH